MTVSKALRYAVLERDGHTCKSCGRTPPEVKLQIDHVIPVALGGGDGPENLRTLCAGCNGAKAAIPADAPLVASVADDALRWAEAMQLVAERRAAERADAQARYDAFYDKWNDWYSTDWRGNKVHPELPGAWERSIDQFLDAGLAMDDLFELIRVAMSANTKDEWKYFCGCCWRRVKQDQKMAAQMLTAPAPSVLTTPTGDDQLSTRVTRSQIKNSLRWVTERLVREFNESEEEVIDLTGYSCIHENNLADCGDLVCVYICLAECFMSYHATDVAHKDAAEHPPAARGWFKSVWYGMAWNLGRRTWKDVQPQYLEELRAQSAEAGLTPEDRGFVDDEGKIYYTDAPRPNDLFEDVDYFLAKGLGRTRIESNVVEAMSAPIESVDMWSYFRGCCRRDLALAGEGSE